MSAVEEGRHYDNSTPKSCLSSSVVSTPSLSTGRRARVVSAPDTVEITISDDEDAPPRIPSRLRAVTVVEAKWPEPELTEPQPAVSRALSMRQTMTANRERMRLVSCQSSIVSGHSLAEEEAAQIPLPTPVLGRVPATVRLHIYDVGNVGLVQKLNSMLRVMGAGAFHCGVEVYDREWSYGMTSDGGTGVFCLMPRECPAHTYRESVTMGATDMSMNEVLSLLKLLETEWPGGSYDLLAHNCCHFSDEMSRWLGVGAIPCWITRLANTGAGIKDYSSTAATTTTSRVDTVIKDATTAVVAAPEYLNSRRKSMVGKMADWLAYAACSGAPCQSVKRERQRLVTAGKRARGAMSEDEFRVGDFSRGVYRRFSSWSGSDDNVEVGDRVVVL